MAKIAIYQALAREIARYESLTRVKQDMTAAQVREDIDHFVKNKFPSGGEFDRGTWLDWELSTSSRLLFRTAFHHMDDNGFYDGWTDHHVNVKGDLCFGFTIVVGGRDKRGVKDYIHDTFHTILGEKIGEYSISPVRSINCRARSAVLAACSSLKEN